MNWNRVERASAMFLAFAVMPILQILLALGSAIVVGLQIMLHLAGAQALMPVLNDGISPTSMQSGNTPQASLSTHYNKNFIENLKARMVMLRMCTRFSMPAHAGQSWRDYMITPLGPNLNQQSEGTIGAGISVNTNFQDIQLMQLADFLNISDKAFITSISDDLVNYEKEMAYRLAFSVDDLVMALFDYLRTLDSKTANQDVTTGGFLLTKAQIEQAPFSLEGQNVLPVAGGSYAGKIHPFFIGDMLALDTGNNSIVDIMKHTPEGLMKLEELPNGPDGDEVKILELVGCRWMRSTNVTQTSNYQSGGNTALRTYLAGKDAIIAIKLDRADRTNIGEGKPQNMTLWRGEYKPGNVADPAGVIGAGTSYNAILGFGVPPDTTSRARCFDAVPQTT